MNNPYQPKGLNLTREDKVEWYRYERGNYAAKWHYYDLRDYVENLRICPVCEFLTWAEGGIHATCQWAAKGAA